MQKELYESPELEMVLVDREDIITDSGDSGDNKTPFPGTKQNLL